MDAFLSMAGHETREPLASAVEHAVHITGQPAATGVGSIIGTAAVRGSISSPLSHRQDSRRVTRNCTSCHAPPVARGEPPRQDCLGFEPHVAARTLDDRRPALQTLVRLVASVIRTANALLSDDPEEPRWISRGLSFGDSRLPLSRCCLRSGDVPGRSHWGRNP